MTQFNLTRRVATFRDGSQVFIEEWEDNDFVHHATAATRPHPSATWGPPAELKDPE